MKAISWICSLALAVPVFAKEPARNVRIVDFGSDLGSGDLPYRGRPPERKVPYEPGMGGDARHEAGKTFVSAWPFSLTEPLNPPGLRYDTTQKSAQFFGGLVTLTLNNPERGLSEGHLNANHAFRDDVNFMALQGGAFRPGEEIEAYGLWIWKKTDFLNGGNDHPVTFDAGSRIAVHVSRYWGGVHAGRWIVQDGETFLVSEKTFSDIYKQFTAADKENPIVHHTQVLQPTGTRWAVWTPRPPYGISFDHRNAEFLSHEFRDIRAVGFLVTRELSPAVKAVPGGLSPNQPIAVKWYAFRCDAVVGNGNLSSPILPMVPIASTGLEAGQSEVTFFQWEKVRRIAVTNQYGRDLGELGYTFSGDGSMGSMRAGDHPHQPGEPVTDITWLDAAVWCNALSELEGREPAYYTDAGFREVLRRTFDRDQAGSRPQRIFWKPEARGYRLPTESEWAALALSGANDFNANPARHASGTRRATVPVASLASGPQGLRGLNGNVWEYVWPASSNAVDPGSLGAITVLGGDFLSPADPTKTNIGFGPESPFENGSYNLGFRVVSGPIFRGASPTAGIPLWTIPRGAVIAPGEAGDAQGIRSFLRSRLSFVTAPDVGLADEREFVDPVDLQERNNSRAKALNDKFLGISDGENPRERTDSPVPRKPYALSFGKSEIPFSIWNRVRGWAAAHDYRFNYPGDMGSMRIAADPSEEFSPEEPVTFLSWYDAVAWCNALSELLEAHPVYFTDPDKRGVFRAVSPFRLETYGGPGYPNPVWKKNRKAGDPVDTALNTRVFFDASRDGFRLPLYDEFRALEAIIPASAGEWTGENAKGRTHPAASLDTNPADFDGLRGNVLEWGWDSEAPHLNALLDYRINGSGYFFEPPATPKANKAFHKEYTGAARSIIGFRVVQKVRE